MNYDAQHMSHKFIIFFMQICNVNHRVQET